MIEQEAPEMPLSVQADLLGISRSSLYYRRQMPSAQEVALKHKIDEIYTRWPFYGSRRMAIALQRGGLSVSRPTVQRHMREMGLAGVAPGPNTSQPGPEHTIYPYLLRHVTAEYPNHIWGVDVTYIRLQGGWPKVRHLRDVPGGDSGLVLALRRRLGAG
jgi:putative transposase